jgi:hypothetical protein
MSASCGLYASLLQLPDYEREARLWRDGRPRVAVKLRSTRAIGAQNPCVRAAPSRDEGVRGSMHYGFHPAGDSITTFLYSNEI